MFTSTKCCHMNDRAADHDEVDLCSQALNVTM